MKVKIMKLSENEVQEKGIKKWPVWEKEISRFNWEYDSEEHCQILEGQVIVETDEGNVELKAGDYVIFEAGLKCVWDIKKNIKKHYNFY